MMYFKVVRYKQNVMKQDKTDKIICPDGTSFLQFVSDDTDGQLLMVKIHIMAFALLRQLMENFQIIQFNDKKFLEISWKNG